MGEGPSVIVLRDEIARIPFTMPAYIGLCCFITVFLIVSLSLFESALTSPPTLWFIDEISSSLHHFSFDKSAPSNWQVHSPGLKLVVTIQCLIVRRIML